MKFSDEDLFRYKESFNAENHVQTFSIKIPRFELQALLARLEAAEVYAKASYAHLDSGAQYDWIDKLHQAWRGAKGEEDVKSKG